MAALQLICKLQSKSPTLGIISREIALDIADAIYEPQLVSHIPGLANVSADALSRRFVPDRTFTLPTALQHAAEVQADSRLESWWRSIHGVRHSQRGA